jgi:hypothetical protein
MAMDKDIFSREQEQQILKALDAMDGELGIDKLDDEEGLRAIFSKYPERTTRPQKEKQKSWLEIFGNRRLTRIGDVLSSPAYAIGSLLLILGLAVATSFQAFQINNQSLLIDSLKAPKMYLRGEEEIFQIVENPVNEALALSEMLLEKDIPHTIKLRSSDRVEIEIPINETTQSLLNSRRIELPPGETGRLIFEKTK